MRRTVFERTLALPYLTATKTQRSTAKADISQSLRKELLAHCLKSRWTRKLGNPPKEKGARMKGISLAGLALVVALAGCGGGESSLETAEPKAQETQTTEERPGNPEVYRRIEGMTDCAVLQKEFDTAAGNRRFAESQGNQRAAETSTSFMEFTSERMEELGC